MKSPTPAASARDRTYVSSSALTARTVPALVEECARLGVRRLELTSSVPHDASMRRHLVQARRRGLEMVLHNYFPPPSEPFVINLASADSAIRSRSIDHCRAALDLSAELEAPFYSVHAGFLTDPHVSDLGRTFQAPDERRMEEAVITFHETVALLCETATSVGVDLLIENNVVSMANAPEGRNRIFLGVVPDDVDALMAAVPSPRLGVLLDVAHLKVSARTLGADVREALARMRPHVRALHLSDNDGEVDDNQPFAPDAWFVPYLSTFAGVWFSIETQPLSAPALHACMKIVEGVR